MTFSEAIEIIQGAAIHPTQAEACEVIFQFMEQWGDSIKYMESRAEEDK